MAIDFSNKKTIAIAAGAAAVVLIGAGIIGVRAFSHGPRTVEQALVKLAAADTLHAQVELSMNLPERFQGRRRPLTKVVMSVAGDVAESEDRTPELTGRIKGEARGRGTTFFFDGGASILRDQVAFRLSEFPVLLNPSGSLSNRWTYVDVPLLATNNSEAVKTLLSALAGQARYQGRSTIDGASTLHYSVPVTPEQEDELVAVFELSASGNRALHTLARLLRANNVDAFDLYINSSTQELTRATLHFVRPLPDNTTYDFAQLTLAFTDYGKRVTVERPPQEAHVRPDVFGNIFGTGEVQQVAQ